MNILEDLKRKLQVWHERRAERIEAARQAELDAEARERVQVMEFNGELYVSVYGVPLFGVEDLKGELTEAVAHGRANYKDWKEEQLFSNSQLFASSSIRHNS
jgi:hypothetical protein